MCFMVETHCVGCSHTSTEKLLCNKAPNSTDELCLLPIPTPNLSIQTCPRCTEELGDAPLGDAKLEAALQRIKTECTGLIAYRPGPGDNGRARTRDIYDTCGHFDNQTLQVYPREQGDPDWFEFRHSGRCHGCCVATQQALNEAHSKGNWATDPWGEGNKFWDETTGTLLVGYDGKVEGEEYIEHMGITPDTTRTSDSTRSILLDRSLTIEQSTTTTSFREEHLGYEADDEAESKRRFSVLGRHLRSYARTDIDESPEKNKSLARWSRKSDTHRARISVKPIEKAIDSSFSDEEPYYHSSSGRPPSSSAALVSSIENPYSLSSQVHPPFQELRDERPNHNPLSSTGYTITQTGDREAPKKHLDRLDREVMLSDEQRRDLGFLEDCKVTARLIRELSMRKRQTAAQLREVKEKDQENRNVRGAESNRHSIAI